MCKQLITFIITFNTTVEQTRINYEAIKKINDELTINSKRVSQYVTELHQESLCNTARVRLLFKSAKIGMYECDSKGRCIWVNQSLCDMFGMSAQDMLGNGWIEGVVPEERIAVSEAWNKSVKNDTPYEWSYTIYNKAKDVKYKVTAISITVRDERGAPILYCGSTSINTLPEETIK